MTDPTTNPIPLSNRIQHLLTGLRWRIRGYVFFEGLALAVAWLAITFWIALLIDIMPVWLLGVEMPLAVRVVMLAVISGVLGFILYRWILRRVFVPLADHSMAVLLEKHNAGFHDGLLTSVELHEQPDHAQEFNPEMLAHTNDEAMSHLASVRLNAIFNIPRLIALGLMAVVLAIPIAMMVQFQPDLVKILFNRVYLLKEDTWPRKAELQIVGIEVRRATVATRASESTPVLSFENKRIKVAKGSRVTLLVRAVSSETKEPPRVCTLHYRTEESRGRRNMKKIGRVVDGFQRFTFEDQPLDGILSTINFDIRGLDHWLRDYTIEVVDNPLVTDDTSVDYTYPAYVGKEPGSIKWFRGMELPRGTELTLRATANKPLQHVVVFDTGQQRETLISMRYVSNADGKEPVPVSISTRRLLDEKDGESIDEKDDETDGGTPGSEDSSDGATVQIADEPLLYDMKTSSPLKFTLNDGKLAIALDSETSQVVPEFFPVKVREESSGRLLDATVQLRSEPATAFAYHLPSLDQNLDLEITLLDTDGVISDRPHKLAIGAIVDEAPRVDANVKGIGGVVTPNVIIPMIGTIEDDFGVGKAWIEVVLQQNKEYRFDFPLQGKDIKTSIDFRDLAGKEVLKLNPKDQLVLNIAASDKYDLEGDPNIGKGSPIMLEVVTEDELLMTLERRELSLRQRFEQIVEEVTVMRDSLAHIREELSPPSEKKSEGDPKDKAKGTEPEDSREPGDKSLDPAKSAQRAESLRLLRAQRAQLQTEKSRQETLGVAEAFVSISEEIRNNRIDAKEREQRLEKQIAAPLQKVGDVLFKDLYEELRQLEKHLKDEQGLEHARLSVEHVDDILLEMEDILQKMLDLETFNELIDLVRSLIDEQEKIRQKTEAERKRAVLKLLQ